MITRIVVFPVLGRRWAFHAAKTSEAGAQVAPVSLKQLWQDLHGAKTLGDRFELVSCYGSEKMHEKWTSLEKAPVNSIRNRVNSIGQKLLSRLEPSEFFLKSVPKDATKVEIVFPTSINPRLVRRRVRHVAISGSIFHRQYMYGSCALLPFTALLGVLPFPNIPLFWNLFRAHAHWRALQGSRKLLQLVADDWESGTAVVQLDGCMKEELNNSSYGVKKKKYKDSLHTCPWVLSPSKKLENLVAPLHVRSTGISDATVNAVCQEFHMDSTQVLKWRDHK